MAIQINPNQPIVFNQPENCFDQPEFFQIIDQTDTTQIQIVSTPCLGADQVIRESSFGTYPSGEWNFSGFTQNKRGEVCLTAGSTGEIKQYNIFTTGDIYQITVSVLSLFGEMKVYNGQAFIGTITQTGDSVFTFTATNGELNIKVENTTYSACITAVTAFQINENFLAVVRNYDDDSFAYQINLALLPGYFVFSKNTLTLSIPWSDLALDDGCYYLSLDDGCNNVCGQLGLYDQEMMQLAPWVKSGGGTLSYEGDGLMSFNAIGTTIIVTNTITEFCAGITYNITVTIANLVGTITFTIGDATSAGYTTDGVKNFQLTPTTAGNFYFSGTNVAPNAVLSGLTIELVNESDYSFQYNSAPFKLGTFPCTLLLNISNDNDAFDFVFVGSGFAPRIRLDATIRNSKYPATREIIETASGSKQIYFGRQRKEKELATEGMPEYVHDFLSLMFVADHLFIDGIEYNVEDDEPNLSYPDGTQDYAQLQALISVKEQSRENRHIGNPSNPISATEGFIVHPINRLEILTEPSTGDTVEAL